MLKTLSEKGNSYLFRPAAAGQIQGDPLLGATWPAQSIVVVQRLSAQPVAGLWYRPQAVLRLADNFPCQCLSAMLVIVEGWCGKGCRGSWFLESFFEGGRPLLPKNAQRDQGQAQRQFVHVSGT